MPTLQEMGLKAVMEMQDFLSGSKEYNDKLDEMSNKTEGAASIMSTLGKGVTAVGITAGIAAAAIGMVLVGAIKKLGEEAWTVADTFDAAFDNIIIKTGASGDALVGLQDDLKDVFASVPTDAYSASQAISSLNSKLELTGPVLQDVAKAVLEMTRMTGGSVEANSNAIADVANKWQLSGDQMVGVLDMIFVAAQQSGGNVGSLISQLGTYGAILQEMGYSLVDATALIANFEEAGVNAGTAIMGMRTAAQVFTKAGVDIDAGFATIAQEIKSSTTDVDALTIATKVFGARAAPEMITAIRNGAFELGVMTTALQGSQGAIADTSQATMDSAEKFQIMKQQAQLAILPIGTELYNLATTAATMLMPAITSLSNTFTTVFAPALMNAMPAITNLIINGLNWLVNFFMVSLPAGIAWFQANWPWIQVAMGLLAVTIVITLLPALVGLIATLWSAVTAGFALAASILVPLAPIVLIIAAITALYYAWTTNWGGMRDTVTKAWDSILLALQPLVDWLEIRIPAAIETVKGWFASWHELMVKIYGFFGIDLDKIWARLVEWFGVIVEWLKPVLDGLGKLWQGFKDVAAAAGETIGAAWGAGAAMLGAGQQAADGVPGLWAWANAMNAAQLAANGQFTAVPGSAPPVDTGTYSWDYLPGGSLAPIPIPPMPEPLNIDDLLAKLFPEGGLGGGGGGGGGGTAATVARQLTDLEKLAIEFARTISGLMTDAINAYTDSLGEQMRMQAQLDLAMGKITQDVFAQIMANADMVDSVEGLNNALELGVLTWEDYVAVMADGIVTAEEYAPILERIAVAQALLDANIAAQAAWEELQDFMGGRLGDDIESYVAAQESLTVGMDEVARRMGVLASRGDLTTFEQAKLAELQAQYDALQEQYQENARVHQQATRQILFDLIAQQAAVDGVDVAELAMLTALAEGWGLVDDATVNAVASIAEAMAYYADTGDMEGFLAMINAIVAGMDPFLPGSPVPLAKGLKAITKQMGGLIQSYDKFNGVLADATLSSGFTTSMNAPSMAPSYSAAPNYYEGNRTVNVNMGGVSVNESLNATQLEALIIRTVKKGIRNE